MPNLAGLNLGLLVLASFLASATSTSLGFGFGMVLVSLLQFFVPPVQIVGLGIIIGAVNCLFRVVETRRVGTDGTSLRVAFSGVLGVSPGVGLLRLADPLGPGGISKTHPTNPARSGRPARRLCRGRTAVGQR